MAPQHRRDTHAPTAERDERTEVGKETVVTKHDPADVRAARAARVRAAVGRSFRRHEGSYCYLATR